MNMIWHEFDNNQEQATALAKAVADALTTLLVQQPHAVLAVSGGRSPIPFFDALSHCKLDWSRVRIMPVDERLVPTSHPDSNTALIRQHLMQHQAAAATWLPLVSDEANEAMLTNTDDAVNTAMQHFQQPDIVILGMGTDGHTASLFPQAPQLSDGIKPNYPHPLLHTSPQTAPHERITLTLPAILAAPYLFLSIQGKEKYTVLQQAIAAPSHTLPISLVLHAPEANCHVYYAH